MTMIQIAALMGLELWQGDERIDRYRWRDHRCSGPQVVFWVFPTTGARNHVGSDGPAMGAFAAWTNYR